MPKEARYQGLAMESAQSTEAQAISPSSCLPFALLGVSRAADQIQNDLTLKPIDPKCLRLEGKGNGEREISGNKEDENKLVRTLSVLSLHPLLCSHCPLHIILPRYPLL